MSDGAQMVLYGAAMWLLAAACLTADWLVGWDGFAYIAGAEAIMGVLFGTLGAYYLARR